MSKTPDREYPDTLLASRHGSHYVVWGTANDEICRLPQWPDDIEMGESVVRLLANSAKLRDALRHVVRQVKSGGPVDLGPALKALACVDTRVPMKDYGA